MKKAEESGTPWELWEQFQEEWEPPEETPSPADTAASDNTSLVPISQLHAVRLLWEDSQRREQDAKEEAAAQQQAAADRERELQEQINQLLRELGKTEGELAALKAKPKSFWARLLGGGE
jgi:hypothetical protein